MLKCTEEIGLVIACSIFLILTPVLVMPGNLPHTVQTHHLRFQIEKTEYFVGEPIFVICWVASTDKQSAYASFPHSDDWRLVGSEGAVRIPNDDLNFFDEDAASNREYREGTSERRGLSVRLSPLRRVLLPLRQFGNGTTGGHKVIEPGVYKLAAEGFDGDSLMFEVKEPLDRNVSEASAAMVQAVQDDSLWYSAEARWQFHSEMLDKYSGTTFEQEALAGLLFLARYQSPYASKEAATRYATELLTTFPRSGYCKGAILALHQELIDESSLGSLKDSLKVTAEYFRDTVIGDLAESMILLLDK